MDAGIDGTAGSGTASSRVPGARRVLTAQEAAAGALTVIPAFEVTDSIPSEQHELFAQLDVGSAELFHVSRFPQGHQPTDLGAALFLCTSLLYLAG